PVPARVSGEVSVRRPLLARGRALAHPGTRAPPGRAAPSGRLLPPGPGMTQNGAPALEVVDLVKHYRVGARIARAGSLVHAVDGVSFELRQNEVLGLVGESGSGKTTVANCVLRLVEPTTGTIRLRGTDITRLSRGAMRPLRRDLH